MIVNVHMTDGRTVFQLPRRADISKLIHREPDDDGTKVQAFVRWTPDSPWQPMRVTFFKRHSIAFVVSAEDAAAQADDVAAELPAEQLLKEQAARRVERERQGQPA